MRGRSRASRRTGRRRAAAARAGAGNKRFAGEPDAADAALRGGRSPRRGELSARLKLLADAALVGFPNAGKCTLLPRMSNAGPKIADYPFTTFAPDLGTVEAQDGLPLVVADIPG